MAAFLDVLERRAVALESRLLAGQLLPALNNNVTILWIELEAIADALGDLGSGERRARSRERLVDDLPAPGVVQDRSPHQLNRFLRRVIEFLLVGAAHDELG